MLAGTVFESCKLDLYKLLLGIFLFFNENKGINAIDLCSHLDVNYRTASFLETKCRILVKVNNENINHKESNHRLYWLNTIIGNVKNNIKGIYHGVVKREMPLFLNEQEYRFNHRYTGKQTMNKVKEYLQRSFPISHRQIVCLLNISLPYFSSTC